ncbi:hypothetical protein [Xanthomonas arboricola]|uniref:hypothetical protein n=1 Tax=Xanthomonas arboricola TaxID=56448 RepID=UPI000CB84855|nr:hypothetical protein [Xanthomonas arboricola]SOT96909.1 Hypothetical Protein CFBP6773_01440 [Xanthomonas arboricola pv. fragariae]
MADLWEVSVVLALRDLQWIMLGANDEYPPPAVNLSGNAESIFGDSLLNADEKFFLLEVKSTSAKSISEWALTGEGEERRHTKRAFVAVKELAKKFGQTSPTPNQRSDVLASLLCHQLAFWEESIHALCIQPYLTSTLSGYVNAIIKAKHDKKTMLEESDRLLNIVIERIGKVFNFSFSGKEHPTNTITCSECSSGSASSIYTSQLGISVKSDDIKGGIAWIPLGLPAINFNEYLQSISKTSNPDGEEINAIILSDKGFIRVVRNTKEIIEFIAALNGIIPSADTASADRSLKTKPSKPIAKANNLSSRHMAKVVNAAHFMGALTSKVDVSQ